MNERRLESIEHQLDVLQKLIDVERNVDKLHEHMKAYDVVYQQYMQEFRN